MESRLPKWTAVYFYTADPTMNFFMGHIHAADKQDAVNKFKERYDSNIQIISMVEGVYLYDQLVDLVRG